MFKMREECSAAPRTAAATAAPSGDSDALYEAARTACAAESAADETGGAMKPLWWRVLAYLPEGPLYVDCATCLFWRGAIVGAVLATGVALCL